MNETIDHTRGALRIATTSSALSLLDGSVSAVGSPRAASEDPMLTFCYCIGASVRSREEAGAPDPR